MPRHRGEVLRYLDINPISWIAERSGWHQALCFLFDPFGSSIAKYIGSAHRLDARKIATYDGGRIETVQ
jgi:hypothetical protein